MSMREVWTTYGSLPRVAYLLSLGTFVNKAGSFIIAFLTLYLSESLGYSKSFATLCMGVFGLGGIVASLLGGQFADQFGRRRVMMFALVGGAAALMVLSTLRSQVGIAVGIFVFALIVEMYRPAAAAMMADVVPPEQRNLAFGVLYVATNLGFAFGASVGGWLAENFSFAWLFYGDAATTFLFAIWIAFVIPESLKRRAKDGGGSDDTPSPSFLDAWRAIGRDWTFLLFCLAALMSGLVFFQGMSTLPLYLGTIGIPKDVYGWLISSNGLMIAIFQLPYGTFLSRFRRIRVIASGTFFVALGFGLVRFSETPLAIGGTILIWTIGEMMQAPFMAATVATLAPTDLRARYQGVFSMCFGAAVTLGAPLGGVVLEKYGGHTLWVGCAVVAGASGVIFLGISGGMNRRETGDGVKESP
ncbi:MAG: MFS transporter [Planctomycetota bacterium]